MLAIDDCMEEGATLRVKNGKSIEQIFNEVKSYDLVLTVDAPLADALNARLDRARLGSFATTPRRLALNKITSEEKIIKDKRELFLKIIEETSLKWKETIHILQNILECWKETGNADKILDQDIFDKEETKGILHVLKNTTNPYTAMEKYKVPEEKKVAVVSFYQFNDLDRKILPKNYDKIGVFTKKETELTPFHIFNSTTEIIETIVAEMKNLDPKDVAVVMKKDSSYMYSIESQFRSNDIPYMVSKDITECESLRKFLNLIRASFFKDGIKVKDIKPLLSEDVTIDPNKEEYLLRSYSDKEVKEIKELLNEIPEISFGELLNTNLFQDLYDEIKTHLEKLDIFEKSITLERVNSFIYYLEAFDIEIESASQGVLIASPTTSMFIDRPVIFYLGMDTSWTPETPPKPWIDKKQFDIKNIKDFEILLQNGEDQYYLVKDREMGRTVIPSFYLNEFTDERIESFRDFKHQLNKKKLKEKKSAFTKEEIETETELIKKMSQSALNTFAYCPKDQFFSELVETPDKVYFRSGTLFHDFAEFYLNYPELANKKDKVMKKIEEELEPFLDEYELALTKTRFNIGIENLKKFLDEKEPRIKDPNGYTKKYRKNIFSELFDVPIKTKYTETSFYNEDIGAKGKIDLILDEDHIVDHKSGRKKSIYSMMRRSDTEKIDEKANFQAKMYLAHHRDHYPETSIDFTYYHLLDNIRDVISGNDEYSNNALTVKYHPCNFNYLTQGKNIFNWLKSSNRRTKVLKKLGYTKYRDFFKSHVIPECEKKEIKNKKITSEFMELCEKEIGSYNYVKQGCKSVMKQLITYRETHYFKEDLDEFEKFLKKNIDLYNEYKNSSFPVGDIDIDKIENEDLVIP